MHSPQDLALQRLHGEMRISARRAAADRLARENHRKDLFIATVAHELRNMMAPLGSALDLIDRGGEGLARRGVGVARRQFRHMAYLIEELLDVARVVNGQVVLMRQEFDLRGVVAETVESCEPMFKERGQLLELHSPAESIPMHGDPMRWTQVVMNLLHNASKFTPAGGTVKVTLHVREDEGVAEMSVADTGQGIPRSDLERIFEMFRSDKAPGSNGLGIGLALVRQLVQLHGGSISARSAGRNRGATFTVRVPVLPSRAVPSLPVRAPAIRVRR